jgi:hypothetical protein
MPDTKTRSFVLSFLAGLMLAGLSLYGFILLRSRPGLPDGINIQELVRIDDVEIQSPKDIEFVLTRKRIGDWLDFEIRREGDIEFVRAQVIAFYSKVPFPLIYLFIGLFCYLIGFTVFALKWEDSRARVLHWLAVVFAYSLIVSGGTYCLGQGWFSYVPVVLFYLSYPLAPTLLFHFSASFASRQWRGGLLTVYLLSLLFAVFFISAVLIATLLPSITVFRLYISVFQIFRSYMVLLLLLAVFHFVLVYRRAVLEENPCFRPLHRSLSVPERGPGHQSRPRLFTADDLYGQPLPLFRPLPGGPFCQGFCCPGDGHLDGKRSAGRRGLSPGPEEDPGARRQDFFPAEL